MYGSGPVFSAPLSQKRVNVPLVVGPFFNVKVVNRLLSSIQADALTETASEPAGTVVFPAFGAMFNAPGCMLGLGRLPNTIGVVLMSAAGEDVIVAADKPGRACTAAKIVEPAAL